MEIFIEEMVKKHKDGLYFAKLFALGVVCAVIVALLMGVVLPIFPGFGSIIFLLSAGCVYGAYYLIIAEELEFEYSLVNNEIDIDKIVNRKKRKRITTANLRTLESFGTAKNPDFARYLRDAGVKKLYACRDKNADDVFFLVYSENTVKKMLIFTPSEKIIDIIVKYNPKKVLI
ncbi:MAG: FHIPEP family type III secretion protein [Ruminococcaceae bacterium]|nr:FHIPEP family type III secretion protein [Oscillospiraceae bacterium]